MKINENFIMKMQSYMFTIVMIFLLVFGIGSLVTTGTLKAGDSALADALTKKATDSQSTAVMNNNENKVKKVTVVKNKTDKKDTDKKTDKKETPSNPSSSSGSNQSQQNASPANVVRTQAPAASTTSSSFNVQLSQAPDLVWSAIEISAVKPTMPSPTQKPTVAPTQSTTAPVTKPTQAPTTEVTEPSTEELTTEPPTEELTTEPTTEELTTEPPTEELTTEPTTEPIDDTEPTDSEDTTSEGDTSPTDSEGTTEPHTFDPEATGTTGTSGTEATTVDPSASSEIPTARPDITSITGEPLTTMPEGIDGAGSQDFGANGGSKALNTATLGKNNTDNRGMLGTLLIISIIFSVVAIMLFGVYFHLKSKAN